MGSRADALLPRSLGRSLSVTLHPPPPRHSDDTHRNTQHRPPPPHHLLSAHPTHPLVGHGDPASEKPHIVRSRLKEQVILVQNVHEHGVAPSKSGASPPPPPQSPTPATAGSARGPPAPPAAGPPAPGDDLDAAAYIPGGDEGAGGRGGPGMEGEGASRMRARAVVVG